VGQSNASKDAVFEHKRQNYNSIFRNKPAGQKKVEREKKCPEVQSPYNNNNKYKYSIIVRTLKWTTPIGARELSDPLVCPDQTKVDYCPD